MKLGTVSPAVILLSCALFAAGDEAVLSLPDLQGRPQRLEDYRGRIVVLNFWATWCVPCREEMPVLVALQKKYFAHGVQVIAASADEISTRAAIPAFLRRVKMTSPVWVGATTADMERLGLGSALPATAVIDRDGRIVGRIIGLVRSDDLERRLDWLLGDRRAPPPPAVVHNAPKPAEAHAHAAAAAGLPAGAGEEHEHGGVGVEGASTVPS